MPTLSSLAAPQSAVPPAGTNNLGIMTTRGFQRVMVILSVITCVSLFEYTQIGVYSLHSFQLDPLCMRCQVFIHSTIYTYIIIRTGSRPEVPGSWCRAHRPNNRWLGPQPAYLQCSGTGDMLVAHEAIEIASTERVIVTWYLITTLKTNIVIMPTSVVIGARNNNEKNRKFMTMHWKPRVFMMPSLSSLTAPEVFTNTVTYL